MRKGGYKIIDLKDTEFTVGTAQTIDGIYDSIEGNYRKPLLLSGLTIARFEYSDTFVTAILSGSDYTITAYNYTITITDTDSVTITQ